MNVFNCLIVLVLVCYAVLLTDGMQFRFDYRYNEEVEGWFKLHEVPATWHDAWFKCFNEGAVLASPEDEKLLSVMKMLAAQQDKCAMYTGIHATFSKGDFFTVEGTPLSKIPITWAPGEPDNFENGEDCLIMLSNGTMADVACSDVYPYYCYKKKTKNMFTSGCGTVDNGYVLDSRTGSCYKFHRLPQTWPRAFSTCAGEGGHLAIINNDEEAQVIKELYNRNPDRTMPGKFRKDNVHLGFCDWGERGLWLTIHGQTLEEAGYNKWDFQQPNNLTTGQFCGSLLRSGKLNDIWCYDPIPFICEKAPNSLIDVEVTWGITKILK